MSDVKVVSFCLYGSHATYILGMKENITLAQKYFKDWEVRIYHNETVPDEYIEEYKEMGATCIPCSNIGKNKMNWEGMFGVGFHSMTQRHYWISEMQIPD